MTVFGLFCLRACYVKKHLDKRVLFFKNDRLLDIHIALLKVAYITVIKKNQSFHNI